MKRTPAKTTAVDPALLARAQQAHVGDTFTHGAMTFTVWMLDAVSGDPICDVRHAATDARLAPTGERIRIAAADYPVRVAKTLARGAAFTPAA